MWFGSDSVLASREIIFKCFPCKMFKLDSVMTIYRSIEIIADFCIFLKLFVHNYPTFRQRTTSYYTAKL